MRKLIYSAALATLACGTLGLAGPAVAAEETAAHYSVTETPAGKLMDDPAAAEILKKYIPTVWANDMFHSSGRTLTLKAIQQ